jgi:DNA-binding NarL/FixJ family response regulator
MIRVVIVDDHPVVRAGLAQLLESAGDMEVVGVAENGARAITVVRETRPDVVLMDLQMPVMDGVEATRLVKSEDELHTQVLVLTSFSDRERILGALAAGAVGYLLKDADAEDVLDGIRAVFRGESPLDPKAARELLGSMGTGSPITKAVAGHQLTERELQVLALVREGLANKQIARRLGISERTVKAHLTSIFGRLGVSDRTQAALWAARHDL